MLYFVARNLPEFAPLGQRISRGRRNLKNVGVDILLLVDGTDEIAGIHARFAWVKGEGWIFPLCGQHTRQDSDTK
jgi:hypothetical protein